jgi:hypothetical protein
MSALLLLLLLLQGDIEAKLATAAGHMVSAFEALLQRVMDPLPDSLVAGQASSCSSPRSPRASSARPGKACLSPLDMGMRQYRRQMERSYSVPAEAMEEVQQVGRVGAAAW